MARFLDFEMAFFEQRLGATLLSPGRKQQLRESMLQQLDLDAHLGKDATSFD